MITYTVIKVRPSGDYSTICVLKEKESAETMVACLNKAKIRNDIYYSYIRK